MRLRVSSIALIVVALLMVPLTGCQKADVKVDKNGNNVTVTGEDGQVEINAGGQASEPEGFPKDVPTYDDAKVVASNSATYEGQTTYTVAYQTGDDVKTVHAWYKKELPKEEWRIEGDTLTGSGSQATGAIVASKGDSQLTVGSARNEGAKKTTITLNVTE